MPRKSLMLPVILLGLQFGMALRTEAAMVLPDINNDGRAGLAESIYILQVLTDMRPLVHTQVWNGPDSPFGFHPVKVEKTGYAYNGFVDGLNLGIGWTRKGAYAFWFDVQPDINDPAYNFTLFDAQLGEAPAGMHILANIAPQAHIDEGRCQAGSWLPVDEDKYIAFVKATVERYDGDGVSDAPGLPNPITCWQVGNEPNNQTRTDFAGLQRLTYQAIKNVCPSCVVLIGGVPGSPTDYTANFDAKYAPILSGLNGGSMDVFDFHWFGDADGDYLMVDGAGHDVLDHLRQSLNAAGFAGDLPIWITEMGSYSGTPATLPMQTERQQAGDYFRRLIYPLARGVKKVFLAFGLAEGFKGDNGYFDHTGLIYDNVGADDLGLGVKKLAYYTYKKMTQLLSGADGATLVTLHNGAGSDNLFLFRILKNEQAIYIAWWDYFKETDQSQESKALTISGLTGSRVNAVSVVPSFATGAEVINFRTAFSSTPYSVIAGQTTILLGKDPVIITEGI